MRPDPRIATYTALWLIPGAVIAGVAMIFTGFFGGNGELAIAGSILIGALILSGNFRGSDPPEIPS